jgi:hypothetical protein
MIPITIVSSLDFNLFILILTGLRSILNEIGAVTFLAAATITVTMTILACIGISMC